MRSLRCLVALKTVAPDVSDARVDPEERELTDERVGHDLEGQRGERRVVGRGPLENRLVLCCSGRAP